MHAEDLRGLSVCVCVCVCVCVLMFVCVGEVGEKGETEGKEEQ